ncbi:hypothetical protein AJ79_09264 [Helicocarpus griseus UAMH5409]|uniref:Uncharacterized protein n=1 Tax=Helicocarpus griseus UAMH5409 TaxID=1447875 RepID=A0A2B7WL63_9EURO|nr:hypothetical protein AJ79_09264 [Helicocarpus griseus UAMH5409]
MSRVRFDRPYPIPEKQQHRLTTLQRLFHHLSSISESSDQTQTGPISRGRGRFSRASQPSRHFYYRPSSGELKASPDSYDPPSRRKVYNERDSQPEKSSTGPSNVPYSRPCPSTLRIPITTNTPSDRSSTTRRTDSSPDLRGSSDEVSIPANADAGSTGGIQARGIQKTFFADFLKGDATITKLDHFDAFLIVYPTPHGDRVMYASESLWSSEDFKMEEFFLHNKRRPDQRTDITTVVDEDGNAHQHLMFFGKLEFVGGHNDLVLVSLVEITDILNALAASDSEIEVFMKQIQLLLSTSEEEPVSNSLASDIMQQLIERVAKKILVLYKDYFILSQSAKEPPFYQISHVSPNVSADTEYAPGHLNYTPQAVLHRISKLMERGKRFSVEIKWGNKGRDKRLYCTPVLSGQCRHWLCMLVDPVYPALWQEE